MQRLPQKNTNLQKKNPLVSICVCHHQGRLIYDFVSSLRKNCSIPIEIIVLSSSTELCQLGIPGCKVFYDTLLPASKRNRGATIANGEYLAIFDDDVEIEDGCIEEMLKMFEDSHVGMVYAKLKKFDEKERFDEAGGFLTNTGFIWSRAGQNIVDEGQYDREQRIFSGKSAACMIPKSLWREIGGMDEDFGILGEESDLSWRVWLLGKEVWWCPKSVAYHKFNTPLKPANLYYTSERVNRFGPRNYITMLLKNLGRENLWILPIHITAWLATGLAMILTGKREQGKNILLGITDVLRNLKRTLKKRKEIQSARVVSDAFLRPIIFSRTPRAYYSSRLKRYLSIGLHG